MRRRGFLKTLEKYGYKNIIGVEPSSMAVDFARKNGANVFLGKVDDIPSILENKNIHTITMFHVIEHLDNPLESLKIIFDNLKTGGNLILETPNIDAYSFKKTNFKHKLIYPEHLFYFNKKT